MTRPSVPPDAPVLRKAEPVETGSDPTVAQPLSVGDLADLKRKLMLLLNRLDRQGSTLGGVGIGKRGRSACVASHSGMGAVRASSVTTN